MSLEQQILNALTYSIRHKKFEVADHLWRAAEALARQSEHEPSGSSRLSIDDIDMVVAHALMRRPSRRSAYSKKSAHHLAHKH